MYLLCQGGEISKLGIAGSCNDINTKYNRKSTLLCQQARQTQLKDLFPHCCWQSLNHIQTLCDCISVFLWEKKGQIDTGCGVNSWQVNNKVVRHQERRGLKEQLTKLYVYKDETKLSLDYCMHLNVSKNTINPHYSSAWPQNVRVGALNVFIWGSWGKRDAADALATVRPSLG